MPFEARKDGMVWGPHHACVTLNAGDEVPSPVRPNLIKHGLVAKVDAVSGKPWSAQPQEAQDAWAETNGASVLTARSNETGKTEKIVVKQYASEMVYADEQVEEPAPAPLVTQEVAGEAATSESDSPAPPMKRRGRPKGSKNKSRG